MSSFYFARGLVSTVARTRAARRRWVAAARALDRHRWAHAALAGSHAVVFVVSVMDSAPVLAVCALVVVAAYVVLSRGGPAGH